MLRCFFKMLVDTAASMSFLFSGICGSVGLHGGMTSQLGLACCLHGALGLLVVLHISYYHKVNVCRNHEFQSSSINKVRHCENFSVIF